MDTISVEGLYKEFSVAIQAQGSLLHRFKKYFFPDYCSVIAVEDISFRVRAGERVAFIGPNGAGKSTTIKILTGILHPTSGQVSVLGKTPWLTRKILAYKIGAIFGQRSQLWYHLPTYETLKLLAAIYDLPTGTWESYLKELIEKFNIGHLLYKPVRQLSLGERMRCEIVASLLHKPEILFLDEPTIGLDATAKAVIRDLLYQQSQLEGTTILLTSHDTGDIEAVCDRVIIINNGKLLLDDSVSSLKSNYIRKKAIHLVTEQEHIHWAFPGTYILKQSPYYLELEVNLLQTSIEQVISNALRVSIIKDLTIEDPPLETVIRSLYHEKNA